MKLTPHRSVFLSMTRVLRADDIRVTFQHITGVQHAQMHSLFESSRTFARTLRMAMNRLYIDVALSSEESQESIYK